MQPFLSLKEHHFKHIGIDRRIIFKWTLRKYGGRLWPGFIWLRMVTSGKALAGSHENDTEPSASIKCREFH
jgi:hypothetical protein